MALELTWGGQTTRVDLVDARLTLGGGADDDLLVAGLPSRFLLLVAQGPRLTLTALRPVRVGAALCPARVPRLLLEGEAVELPGDGVLRRTLDPVLRDSRRTMPTAHVARELLSGDFQLEATRAATLTCVAGPDQGASFPLGEAESVLGRSEQAEVRLRDLAVSRLHAAVVWEGSQAFLHRRRCTNGVYLNGRPLSDKQALRSGDVIELGQTLLCFEQPEALEVPATGGGPGEAGAAAGAPVAGGAPSTSAPPEPAVPAEAEEASLGSLAGGAAAPLDGPEPAIDLREGPGTRPPVEPASPLEVALVAVGGALAVGGLGASAVLLGLTPW